jgi:hypothetical protein
MVLVLAGMFFAVLAIVMRAIVFRKSRRIEFGWQYYLLLMSALFGTMLGAAGFYMLTGTSINAGTTSSAVDYSQILGILSLLTAGITAGFFSFSYNNTDTEEIVLPTILSVSFTVLFYLLFAAISFYMGKSKFVHNVEYADVFGPLIMWFLLVANMAYDFLDYRAPKPPPPTK